MYLTDCVQRGYNSLEFSFIGHDPRGRHVPFNDRGLAPALLTPEMLAEDD